MNASYSIPLLMVILSGGFLAILGLAYKIAGECNCRSMAFSSVFLLFATILAGGRACFETVQWSDSRLWFLGMTMGAILYGMLAMIVHINRMGPASISWPVINLSFLIPILFASFFLKETLRWTDLIVLILFILMLFALRQGLALGHAVTQSGLRIFWILLAIVFLLNGMFQFGSKLKDTFFHDHNAAGLAVIFYGTGTVLAMITHRICSGSLRITQRECAAGLLAGVGSGIGNLLFLNGMSLPVTVSFPVTQSIALIGGVALTTVFFNEPVNRGKVLGWILGLMLLLLTVFRDSIG